MNPVPQEKGSAGAVVEPIIWLFAVGITIALIVRMIFDPHPLSWWVQEFFSSLRHG